LAVAKGLHYLHSLPDPIMHRDIKASNVLLANDTLEPGHYDKSKVVLCDFGVSKLLEEGTIGRTLVGTPGYIAPEVRQSTAGYTEKADIFSFGMYLYEVVTLTRPTDKLIYPADFDLSLAPLMQLITECAKPNPQQRPTAANIIYTLTTCNISKQQ